MKILEYDFERIGDGAHTWEALKGNWEQQCVAAEEDFETYFPLIGQIYEPIIAEQKSTAGVYAVCKDGEYVACLQANTAWLPKYGRPVLRVRHLTLCPTYDLTDVPIDAYARALVAMMGGIWWLSEQDTDMKAEYIHFHLRSPADRNFFAVLGTGLANEGIYKSVEPRGAWLYITKS